MIILACTVYIECQIGHRHNYNILLVLKSCSAHSKPGDLPAHGNFQWNFFLLISKTSGIQQNTKNISHTKSCYNLCVIFRKLEIIAFGTITIYFTNMLTAMRWTFIQVISPITKPILIYSPWSFKQSEEHDVKAKKAGGCEEIYVQMEQNPINCLNVSRICMNAFLILEGENDLVESGNF